MHLDTKRQRSTIFHLFELLIHSHAGKKELIDTLHSHGIGISYNHLLQIPTDLANTVCYYYKEHQVVCPPKLKSGVFTTRALHNIEHNTSSNSAKDIFHGTPISLT